MRGVIGIFEWNESSVGAPIQLDSLRITSYPAIPAGLSILRTGLQVNLVCRRAAPFQFGVVGCHPRQTVSANFSYHLCHSEPRSWTARGINVSIPAEMQKMDT